MEGARSPAINAYVAQFTLVFLEIMLWAIVLRSLMSWFPIDQSSPLVQMLHRVTEPIIEPIRRVMPNMGMMDLSPMMAIVAIIVMRQLVIGVAQPL